MDLLVLPGGMPGAKNLNEQKELKAAIKEHAEKGKVVAAICAAPMVLGGLGLLEGKKSPATPVLKQN